MNLQEFYSVEDDFEMDKKDIFDMSDDELDDFFSLDLEDQFNFLGETRVEKVKDTTYFPDRNMSDYEMDVLL